MRILVTDGRERASLAVVRSLGRAGHDVRVGVDGARSLAAASRYCTAVVELPDPLAAARAFRQALVDAVRRHAIEALVPVSDAALEAALDVRDALDAAGVLLPFADRDAYEAVSDKQWVLENAHRFDIRVPAQVTIACPEEAASLDLSGLPYPVAIKPSRSVVADGEVRTKTVVAYAADASCLRLLLERSPAAAFPFLVQERITGPGIGVFLLVWDGAVHAAFAHRRLREKPPSGGVSVLRESRPLDPDLVAKSVALLDSVGWRGPAMVEYKVDQRTGQPHLMEVNGRYWGSLQLAIDAGLDFPALHMDVARGSVRARLPDYQVGVRTRWLLGDVDHLIARLRRSRRELGLPADGPGRFRALFDFLAGFRPGVRDEIFHWTDSAPAFAELGGWLSRLRSTST